jgi:hypothetical protein
LFAKEIWCNSQPHLQKLRSCTQFQHGCKKPNSYQCCPVITFRLILHIPIEYISNFLKDERYVFQRNLKSTTPSGDTLFYSFFFNPGYEYASFQFSRNDGYAQSMCILIF